MFGILSGLVASFFLGEQQVEENAELKELLKRLDAIDAKLARNESKLEK